MTATANKVSHKIALTPREALSRGVFCYTTILSNAFNYATVVFLHLLVLLAALSAPLTVNVEVLAPSADGAVFLAAYDSADGFDKEEELVSKSAPLEPGASRIDLELELPQEGQYIVAAFQDLNGNGKLDKNFFGVPTEPYGFSKVAPE